MVFSVSKISSTELLFLDAGLLSVLLVLVPEGAGGGGRSSLLPGLLLLEEAATCPQRNLLQVGRHTRAQAGKRRGLKGSHACLHAGCWCGVHLASVPALASVDDIEESQANVEIIRCANVEIIRCDLKVGPSQP